MAQNRVVDYPAPVGGIEWRAGRQKENHAQALVNADLSRGILQARRGFKGISATNMTLARLHVCRPSTDDRQIIAIGSNGPTDNDVKFKAFDEWGNVLGAAQNLTTEFGEPEQEIVLCSFVEQIIASSGEEKPHFSTVISTQYNTYIYEPWKNKTRVRLANTAKVADGGDSFRPQDLIYGYSVTRPHGYIATEFAGQVIYAGLREGDQFWFSAAAESDQTALKEAVINSNRYAESFGADFFCFSEVSDPIAIPEWGFQAVAECEKITGLRSFQENLVIFTDSGISVLTGILLPGGFNIIRVASGVGCAAHNSIVEANGILYFMGHDGVYAFGGLANPQAIKISTPIDALWSGRHDAGWTPEAANATLIEEMHWPWTVAHDQLKYCNVVHYKELNQIWWSVPVQSREPYTFPVTLVFDYANNAWSFHVMNERSGSNGTKLSCMYDGVSIRGRGNERIITSQARGEVQMYGWYRDEASSTYSNDGAGIPMVWVSVPLSDEGSNQDRMKDLRFHILSTGKKPSTNPPKCFISGQDSHYDMQRTTREEKSASLDMHPEETLSEFFFDAAKFNDSDSFFTEPDWFLSKLSARVKSTAWRVGIVDDAGTQDRAPMVSMKAFSAEVKRMGTE